MILFKSLREFNNNNNIYFLNHNQKVIIWLLSCLQFKIKLSIKKK